MLNRIRELLSQNQTIRQTVAKNVFWLSVGQIGSRLIRAFIIIYAARILGASEYGVFAYVLGLAGFFTIFADIGVTSILTREVAKKPEEASYYFATTFWIKITLLLLTAILIIFAAPYFSKIEAAKIILPFVALLTIFDGLRELSASFFRGKEKMELEAILTSATNIAITVFGFIILQASPTSKSLAITYVLSAGTGTLIGFFILRKELARVFSFFKKELVIVILKSALPIALVGVIGALMMQIDILMLGFFKEAKDVGLYSSGQKIIGLLYTLPAILAIGLFPTLARSAGRRDNGKSKLLAEKGITLILFFAIPMVVGGVILGDQIIILLYGQEYLPGANAFRILILTLLAIFPGTIIGNYIFAYDQQKRLAPNTLIGSVSNVIFNVILIPLYGIIGAAIATVSAQLIYNGLNWRFAKKINNFYTLRYLKKIVAATIVMGIFSFLLGGIGLHVILNIILSVAVYFGTLYLLKEPLLSEMRSLILWR